MKTDRVRHWAHRIVLYRRIWVVWEEGLDSNVDIETFVMDRICVGASSSPCLCFSLSLCCLSIPHWALLLVPLMTSIGLSWHSSNTWVNDSGEEQDDL